LVIYTKQMESAGAGEIFLNSIDRDGTFEGYDEELISLVASSVHIPVVAIGGAGHVDDFAGAIKKGASAVAAGSIFVFQRPHRAVLISYPSQEVLKEKIFDKI
jgi:cyclase